MNKKLKQILSIFAAGTVAVTMGLSAFAAPVDEATIDRNRKASLSVYKYDITSAEKDGVWTTDGYQSTGVYDETGVNNILGNPDKPKVLPNGDTSYGYAVKGVEFTYKKVAEISTFSEKGTVANLFGFEAEGTEETMLRSIGLSIEDRVKEADTVINGKQMYYFTSDTLIKAVTDSLADDPIGVKNALETYVKNNGGTAMEETDSYGHTEATNLELGLYLVVETKVPEYVTTTVAPFLISLPMTAVNGSNAADGGTRWIYDVTVYPKNATGSPDLEKTVRESKADTGKNQGKTDDISDGYAQTATGSAGDGMDYQIISTLPEITSAASYLTEYIFADTLSEGLTYRKNDLLVEWYLDKACTEKITEWEETSGKYTVAYGEHTMTITMTEEGLSEINSSYGGRTMRITYAAAINSDDTVVCGDTGNPNEVVLTWKRTNTDYYDTLKDDCHVYTYAIDLTKKFADNKGDFSKVSFVIQNDTDGYFVQATLIDNVYYVTGHAADEADATVFVPTDNGKVVVKGLEDDAYSITETTTDNGYRLLKEAIQVVITAEESDDICPVCLAKTLTALATADGKSVSMTADGDSASAVVPLTVINHRKTLIPGTGEAGNLLFTIGGIALAAVSFMVLVYTRKKKQN